MTKWIFFGTAGLLGTFARYLISLGVQNLLGFQFPYGTLTVNCLGCVISGFFFTLSEIKELGDSHIRFLVQIGFCGALTTFSSLIFETMSLVRNHEFTLACANVGSNLIGGILSFLLGCFLANIL